MKFIAKTVFTAVLCVAIFCNSGHGQVSMGSVGPIRIGPGNVHCSLQDRKGALWFGTTDQGLFRYDGKSFTHFTKQDGLANDGILSLLADKRGGVWIGTAIGLSHFDGKAFENIPLAFQSGGQAYPSRSLDKEMPGNNAVTAMMEDRSGGLWFGTDNGVYRYDGKMITRLLDESGQVNDSGLSMHIVQTMIQDRLGDVWITTKMDGVCRYDGKRLVNFKPDGQEWFRGLLEDKLGRIWAGTRYRGVYRYDGKTFAKISLDESFDSYTVLSIIEDRSGVIWFGTEAGEESKRDSEGGVWRYDGRSMLNVSRNGGLVHPAVWSLLSDKSGALWIGTRRSGLSRWDGNRFEVFSK